MPNECPACADRAFVLTARAMQQAARAGTTYAQIGVSRCILPPTEPHMSEHSSTTGTTKTSNPNPTGAKVPKKTADTHKSTKQPGASDKASHGDVSDQK